MKTSFEVRRWRFQRSRYRLMATLLVYFGNVSAIFAQEISKQQNQEGGNSINVNAIAIAIANVSNSSALMANNQELSEDSMKLPLYMRIVATLACLIIFIVGVSGNFLVPLVVIKTKYLRNSTNLFLINLSMADLLLLIVSMPTVFIELHSRPETWLLGEPMCKLSNFVEMLAAHGSIFTILAISFERYYAICKPLKAGYKCTRLRATIIICIIWLLSVILTSPILIMAKSSQTIYIDGSLVYNCILETDTYWTKMYVFISMFFFFCLPLLVLMLVYWLIGRRLIRENIATGSNHHQHQSLTTTTSSENSTTISEQQPTTTTTDNNNTPSSLFRLSSIRGEKIKMKEVLSPKSISTFISSYLNPHNSTYFNIKPIQCDSAALVISGPGKNSNGITSSSSISATPSANFSQSTGSADLVMKRNTKRLKVASKALSLDQQTLSFKRFTDETPAKFASTQRGLNLFDRQNNENENSNDDDDDDDENKSTTTFADDSCVINQANNVNEKADKTLLSNNLVFQLFKLKASSAFARNGSGAWKLKAHGEQINNSVPHNSINVIDDEHPNELIKNLTRINELKECTNVTNANAASSLNYSTSFNPAVESHPFIEKSNNFTCTNNGDSNANAESKEEASARSFVSRSNIIIKQIDCSSSGTSKATTKTTSKAQHRAKFKSKLASVAKRFSVSSNVSSSTETQTTAYTNLPSSNNSSLMSHANSLVASPPTQGSKRRQQKRTISQQTNSNQLDSTSSSQSGNNSEQQCSSRNSGAEVSKKRLLNGKTGSTSSPQAASNSSTAGFSSTRSSISLPYSSNSSSPDSLFEQQQQQQQQQLPRLVNLQEGAKSNKDTAEPVRGPKEVQEVNSECYLLKTNNKLPMALNMKFNHKTILHSTILNNDRNFSLLEEDKETQDDSCDETIKFSSSIKVSSVNNNNCDKQVNFDHHLFKTKSDTSSNNQSNSSCDSTTTNLTGRQFNREQLKIDKSKSISLDKSNHHQHTISGHNSFRLNLKKGSKRSGSQPIVCSVLNNNQNPGTQLTELLVVQDLSKKQQMDSRRQVVIMLAFVVACFFLLFFPYRVFTIWLILSTEDQVQSLGMETYYNLTYFSRILIYLHSAINPIAYNLISTKFRRAFMSILLCRGSSTRRHFITEHRVLNHQQLKVSNDDQRKSFRQSHRQSTR